MNILYIDTRDNNEITISIKKEDSEFIEKEKAHKLKAQTTLPIIDRLLNKSGISLSQIDEIQVEKGPGSFTGLRVGVAIANALSLANNIKIKGKELGEIEEPIY